MLLIPSFIDIDKKRKTLSTTIYNALILSIRFAVGAMEFKGPSYLGHKQIILSFIDIDKKGKTLSTTTYNALICFIRFAVGVMEFKGPSYLGHSK